MARPCAQETEADQMHWLAHRPSHHPRHRCHHLSPALDHEEWNLLKFTHDKYLNYQLGLKNECSGRSSTDGTRAVKVPA